jgi:hypothetical protein
MRPINRGATPQVNGIAKTVADYKDWRQDLIDRIGNFCSYCNMVLNDSPQVEHVSAKSTNPAMLTTWDNMLLACGPCNRAKSNNPNSNNTHYLPDYHNTHLAFDYALVDVPKRKGQIGCVPVPSSNAYVNQNKALATIALCKLQAVTVNKRATDLRWKYRYEAWITAVQWKDSWIKWGHTVANEFITLLLTAATGKGFFSIWYIVFEDVQEIKLALLVGHPNTEITAFPAPTYDGVRKHPPDL